MSILVSLNREQKEAVGLLQIGTFLEYFDFMLYIHMAVLLNELFFPETDPHTASLLAAFAFCSTWVFRPIGALIFGYIGDHIGRKTTVIITTMMMSLSCVIMANLPTYAQIGLAASWIVTICRIVQGLSSMGEKIGAEIYVSEITKPPSAYPAVAFVAVASAMGAMGALGVATLTTSYGFNWRTAFWIGAGIAVLGSVARTRLRETPEFVDMKIKLKLAMEKRNLQNRVDSKRLAKTGDIETKVPLSTVMSYFFIQCGWPLTFYLVYVCFNPILKDVYGYSSADIIHHNFILTVIQVIEAIGLAYMSYYVYPLKILKVKNYVTLLVMVAIPFWISMSSSSFDIFLLQILILTFCTSEIPAQYIFIKTIPVYRRFTASSFIYASARALTYVVTSFGIVCMISCFGYVGILIITLPLWVGLFWGVRHFEKLEGLRLPKQTRIKEEAVLSKAA